jgi:hypothetical protein
MTVLSWQMDRMTSQGATLHTAPGSVARIIGSRAGAARREHLMLRSWRRARRIGWDAAREGRYRTTRRSESFALAVALFVIYALLLVGRGVPFWLGTQSSSRRFGSSSGSPGARLPAASRAAPSSRSPAGRRDRPRR